MTYELVPLTAQVMPEGHRGPRPVGRAALVAGGVAVVVVAVVAVVAWVTRDESGTDEALTLTPPVRHTLEQALEFIEDDELVEVTPQNIRLRKKKLLEHERRRASKS